MRRVFMCLACLALWVLCSAQSCSLVSLPVGDSYQSVTLKHSGFDFSEGIVPASFETSDGHTTNWPAQPTINPAKEYGPYVWFVPFANTDTENFTKDMGEVALSAVLDVPTEWDAGAGLTLEPLEVGHVYVIKCRDGYAKFLVKAVDPSQDREWAVDVDYGFTAGTTFDH